MRNREVIEREMYRAREDLESNLAELKHVVVNKVDVKARARVAVERGKIKAVEALERGEEKARELYARGKAGAADLRKRGEDKAYFTYLKAKDRPVMTGAILGGIVAAGVLVYVGHKKCWW
jgi:hypothetical protein